MEDDNSPVFFYGSEFYVLSNFSAFRLKWKGLDFDTAEAAYQWEKFSDWAFIRDKILNARSAHQAFKIAEENRGYIRSDWRYLRVEIMYRILSCKASEHEYVKRKLLETRNRELIEDSWRDDFWGWGDHHNGVNMLGKLWMRIRMEIRDRAMMDYDRDKYCRKCGTELLSEKDNNFDPRTGERVLHKTSPKYTPSEVASVNC